MKANKVFNNNAVAVFWHDGREAVLVGSGIGFGKRPGDAIDEKKIQKVYYIQDEQQTRFLQLLEDARSEALQAAEEIIAFARSQGMELKNQLILSLTDHICFAPERLEQGISLPYLMLSETKLLYPRAYEVGLWALEKIRQLYGAELPGYEAGYIALQLASGEMNGEEAYDSLKLVSGVTEIIKNTYGIELNPDDLDTIRLTTHLKFLTQRILRRSQWNDDDMDGIFQMLMFRNPKNRDCIARITGYIRNQFSYELNVWKGVYEIMKNFPETLPNTYLNYYLQQKEFVEHSDPTRTRANEVMETREKNLFEGIEEYLKTGVVKETVFYAGSHGDWIADLAVALKNDTKARFLVITENRGCIPNLPYDAMVEVPTYIGKNGPEVLTQKPVPLFQQGLIMQQLNSEKLIVEAAIEGSYEKALQAFTLNKTIPSMNVAKAVLDDMIEANKGYWPELK